MCKRQHLYLNAAADDANADVDADMLMPKFPNGLYKYKNISNLFSKVNDELNKISDWFNR